MPNAPGDLDLTTLSFEEVMERLEGVVERLEEGDSPLEEALATFELGVSLSRVGNRRLDEAERRIEQLLQSGQTAELATSEPDAPPRAGRSTGGRKGPIRKDITENE